MLALLGLGAVTSAAGATLPSNLLRLGNGWLDSGLDASSLEALRRGDSGAVDAFLKRFSGVLQGSRLSDLRGLDTAARLALPVLERQPKMRAYAPWLRARLDYMKVADKMAPPSSSKPRPGTAPSHPTAAEGRAAWQTQVSREPTPKGAATWVPKLKPVFRSSGAPPELVWLAELESSFDPAARSPAGAAGMFQLMPATARGLGLKLTPVDERLVPEKAARSAAAYLRQMRARYNDWRLALAAYNAGPGRVSDLLRRRGASTFDGIAPALPAETQMYVPKMEAILRRREGLAITSLPKAA